RGRPRECHRDRAQSDRSAGAGRRRPDDHEGGRRAQSEADGGRGESRRAEGESGWGIQARNEARVPGQRAGEQRLQADQPATGSTAAARGTARDLPGAVRFAARPRSVRLERVAAAAQGAAYHYDGGAVSDRAKGRSAGWWRGWDSQVPFRVSVFKTATT